MWETKANSLILAGMVKEEEFLYIRLFGGASITIGHGAPDTHSPLRFKSQRAELMLAYLALNPYVHQREGLATFLWDDRSQEQSLANLRALLARLPKSIKPYLTLTRQTIMLNMEQVWLDIAIFEETLDSIPEDSTLTSEQVATLEEVSELANGRFAAGLTVKDSIGLDEWVTLTREQLQQKQILLAQRLALSYLHQRDYPNAIRHAQTLVKTDSLREDSYRLLMRVLARNGQRTAAIKQYQLCQKMLADEFGLEPTQRTNTLYQRIRTAPANIRHQLPPQPTRFIGRNSERLKLHRWLDTPDQHLITIMGLGGAGKTRLALQVANERRGDYLHGIFFVGFADAENGRQFFLTLARTLGIRLTQQNISEQLYQFLQDKEMLLIFDNLEQLLEQKEIIQFISTLLQKAPDVRLIVTSRERLHLRAEWVLSLAGLANEGQHLFRERAEQITGEPLADQEAIIQICDLVDNLPLGIELAASALTRHPLDEIVVQIQQNLDVLTTQYHDIPDRHRSIRAAFAYSWQILTGEEQTILKRLTFFRGGFSVDAARHIAQASHHQLDDLVGKSLLRSDNGRYALHPLLQQFVQDLTDDPAPILQSHMVYFLERLAKTEEALKGSEQVPTLNLLSEDTENIRAAWQQAIQQSEASLLYAAIPSFAMWHMMRSWYRTGHDLIMRLGEQRWERDVNGRFLVYQGIYSFMMNDYEQSAIFLNQSIEWLPSNHSDLAFTYNFLGEAARWQGELEVAVRYYEMAITIADQHDDNWNRVFATGCLGTTKARLGDEESLHIYNLTAVEHLPKGEVWQRGAALTMLGTLAYRSGQYHKAASLFEETIETAQKMDDSIRMAMWLLLLGFIQDMMGLYDESLKNLEKTLRIYAWTGDKVGLMHIQMYIGQVKIHLGQIEEAEWLFAQAREISDELDSNPYLGFLHAMYSHLHTVQGQLTQAEQQGREDLAIREEMNDLRGKARSYLQLGIIMTQKGVYPLAKTYLLDAQTILEGISDHWASVLVTCALGELALADKQFDTARQQFQQALAEAGEATPLMLRALCGLAQLENHQEWFNLVVQHPATHYETRQIANAHLTEEPKPIADVQAMLEAISLKPVT